MAFIGTVREIKVTSFEKDFAKVYNIIWFGNLADGRDPHD
jgi:hypothetical protein